MPEKKTVSDKFGFYSILTNPVIGYSEIAQIIVDNKISFLQLRMKKVTRESIRSIAQELVDITRGTETNLIINDDPLLAKEVKADGVHLGQDDMSCQEARDILGQDKIIGISTHNPEQVLKANSLKPDYIGIGPVYATPTKDIPDPVLGPVGLKEMLELASIPAVAIGGIDFSNLDFVKKAGAFNWCGVRLINSCKSVEEVIGVIKKIKTF